MAARGIAFQPVAHQTVKAVEPLAHIGGAQWPRRSAWPAQIRTPPTPCPIWSAGAPTSLHRIHDALRSDARCATQPPEHHRARHSFASCARRRNHFHRKHRDPPSDCAPTLHASTIFIQSPHSQAALLGKTPPASIHSLQTPPPEPQLRPGCAASAPLPLRSWLKCTTKTSGTTGCVAQTHTMNDT